MQNFIDALFAYRSVIGFDLFKQIGLILILARPFPQFVSRRRNRTGQHSCDSMARLFDEPEHMCCMNSQGDPRHRWLVLSTMGLSTSPDIGIVVEHMNRH